MHERVCLFVQRRTVITGACWTRGSIEWRPGLRATASSARSARWATRWAPARATSPSVAPTCHGSKKSWKSSTSSPSNWAPGSSTLSGPERDVREHEEESKTSILLWSGWGGVGDSNPLSNSSKQAVDFNVWRPKMWFYLKVVGALFGFLICSLSFHLHTETLSKFTVVISSLSNTEQSRTAATLFFSIQVSAWFCEHDIITRLL